MRPLTTLLSCSILIACGGPTESASDLSIVSGQAIIENALPSAEAERVVELEGRLAEQQTTIATLREELKTTQDARRRSVLHARVASGGVSASALQSKLNAANARIASLHTQLGGAQQQNSALSKSLDRVSVLLGQTQVALGLASDERDQAQSDMALARDDQAEARWAQLVGHAQLLICSKGTRKKMQSCRADIGRRMNADLKDRVVHCVRSGQAAPSIQRAYTGDMPQHFQWLDRGDSRTQDVYVHLCDPTLPEANGGGIVAQAPPPIFDDEPEPEPEPQPEPILVAKAPSQARSSSFVIQDLDDAGPKSTKRRKRGDAPVRYRLANLDDVPDDMPLFEPEPAGSPTPQSDRAQASELDDWGDDDDDDLDALLSDILDDE